MKDRVLVEIGKIKGNLRELWDCAKAEDLERNKCLNAAREIDKSLDIIVNLFETSVVRKLVETTPKKLLIAESITKAFSGKSIGNVVGEGLAAVERTLVPTNLSSLVFYIENPQTYEDKYVKSSIVDFCKDLEKKIIFLEDEFGKESDLLLLAEFTSLFQIFTPNWIVATVYLTAMVVCTP